MKKYAAVFLTALFAAALLLSVPAYAETAVVTPAKGVNLRSGPGTDYEVLLTIPYNTEVTVTGSQGSWYKVSVNGISGYASASYLRFVTNDAGSTSGNATGSTGTYSSGSGSTVSIFSSDTTGTFGNYSGTGTGLAATGSTGAYSSGSGSTVSIFSSGTAGTSGNTYGSTYNYSNTYSSASGTSVSGSSVSGSTVVSGSSTSGAAVYSGSTETAFSGTVTGDYVRLRSGPSVSYSILATVRKGTAVTVTGSYGDWYKCTVNGISGFMSAAYVSRVGTAASGTVTSGTGTTVSIFSSGVTGSSGTAASGTGTQEVYAGATASGIGTVSGTAGVTYEVKSVTQRLGYITGNNVRLRSGPSTSSEILGEFQYGNSVYITGLSGEWVAVTADGKSGFVSGKYVSDGTYTAPAAETTVSGSVSTSSDTAASAAASQDAGSAAASVYSSVTGQQIADLACSFVGTRYYYGGADPETGFDCSGLVYYCYRQYGITLGRTAAAQALNGVHVDPPELRPGDILCFSLLSGTIGHAGIYIGDGKFVHAANSLTGVIVTELEGYYSTGGYEARRIIT